MLRTLAFALVMVLYLWFPWNLIRQQERILEQGALIYLRLEPVDPYDVFRGRYIRLSYGVWEAPAQEQPVLSEPVFVTFRTDSLGFQTPGRIHLEPPADEPYLRTIVLYADPSLHTVQVDPPESLLYYYLNDEIAPLAERYFQELMTTAPDQPEQAYAAVRLLDGEARLEQVFLAGKPVGVYVRERLQQEGTGLEKRTD